jgi:hypothetical protein
MVVVDAVEEDEYARGASTQDRSASINFYWFIIVFHVEDNNTARRRIENMNLQIRTDI